MVITEIDTREFDKWFHTAFLYTKRTTDAFIKGQTYSVIGKISQQIKLVKAKGEDIDEYFEKGIRSRGIKLHKKAIERAENKLSNKYGTLFKGGYFKTRDGKLTKKLIKLTSKEANARKNKIWLNAHQLAVRYEWGLRRSGIGSVRAAWIETLRLIKPLYGKIKVHDTSHLSKPLKNKASDAWEANLQIGKYNFTGVFKSEAYKKPKIISAIQAGFNAAAQDIKGYLERKLNRSLS